MRRTRPRLAGPLTILGGLVVLIGAIVQILDATYFHNLRDFAGVAAFVGLVAIVLGAYEWGNPEAHATAGVLTAGFALLGLAATIVPLDEVYLVMGLHAPMAHLIGLFSPGMIMTIYGIIAALAGSCLILLGGLLGLRFAPEVVWEFGAGPGTQAQRSGPRPDAIFGLLIVGSLLLWAGGVAGLTRSVSNLGFVTVALGIGTMLLAVLPFVDPERYGDQLSTYLILALLGFGITGPIFGNLYESKTQSLLAASPIPGGPTGDLGAYLLHYFPTAVFLMAFGSGLGVLGAIWGTVLRSEVGRDAGATRGGWRQHLSLAFATATVGGLLTYFFAIQSLYTWFGSDIPYLTANGSVGVLGLVTGTFILITASSVYAAPERAAEMNPGLFLLSAMSLLVAIPVAIYDPNWPLLASGVLGVCVGGAIVLAGVIWGWAAPFLAKKPAGASGGARA